MKARVLVKLKNGVLDPQGKAVLHAAQSLECQGVEDIRVGKIFDINLNLSSKEEAQQVLDKLSEKLLANTVIENFEVEIVE